MTILTRTQYVPYEKTVTEKRAPTDESVRLLREMEATALKNVVATLRLDNNVFKAIWYTCRNGFSFKSYCALMLNGQPYTIMIKDMDEAEFYMKSAADLKRMFCEAVRDEVSAILTYELFNTASAVRDITSGSYHV